MYRYFVTGRHVQRIRQRLVDDAFPVRRVIDRRTVQMQVNKALRRVAFDHNGIG